MSDIRHQTTALQVGTVRRMDIDPLSALEAEIVECRRCPRLVEWRERVGREKRASFAAEEYWARPVHGIGDHDASILVVGLAPAAHGANRTGRMFTGDRSGDFLFASLHRTGFASQPTSDHVGDGLRLAGVYITSAVKCAPPDNRPTVEEQNACSPWLRAEFESLGRLKVVVILGGLAYARVMRMASGFGWDVPSPRPKFGHGAEIVMPSGPSLVCSYHPSQQNTFTKRLTPEMLDAVFTRAGALAATSAEGAPGQR